MIKQKYPDAKFNYKSKLYPWKCDCYIPSEDLYIELQGHPRHGTIAFDPNDHDHLNLVKHWKDKSKETNHLGKSKRLYYTMIEGWTISDPMKRIWAKEHKLNWLEFFTIEQFKHWFETLL